MKPITIIGGGVAGLTLGIALRQANVPAVVWESGGYPRHRVCGEFLSGRGLQTLERLGLMNGLLGRGARAAATTGFFAGKRKLFSRCLPEPALCVSRFTLDAFLADEFVQRGGELRAHSRWTSPTTGEGLLRATGRRVQAQASGYRWYGLKAHARGVELVADLEMHFGRDSYVGLCRLSDGVVNVCGLFRNGSGSPLEQLAGEAGSILSDRLKGAVWDESSVCAVGGLPPYPELMRDGCSVGDALAMPAPVSGNGMSMAIESAELSAAPLVEYARGLASWERTVAEIRDRFESAFRRRVQWSALLHRLLFRPELRLLPWNWAWQPLYWAIR